MVHQLIKFSKIQFFKIVQLRVSVYDIIDPIFNLVKMFNEIINKADELS